MTDDIYYDVWYIKSPCEKVYCGFAKKKKLVRQFLLQRKLSPRKIEVNKVNLPIGDSKYEIKLRYLINSEDLYAIPILTTDDEVLGMEMRFQPPSFIYYLIESRLGDNTWYIGYNSLKSPLKEALDILGYNSVFDNMVEYPLDDTEHSWRFISPTTRRLMEIIPNIPTLMNDFGLGGENLS